MSKLRIGFIGLGARGSALLKYIVLPMDMVSVVSVCDTYEDRAKQGAEDVKNASGIIPACETDYKKVISSFH